MPSDGDLVFLASDDRKHFPFLWLTPDEARAQNLWTLHHRSWYGYALNHAAFCAWLPRGAIEKLPTAQRARLKKHQRKVGVVCVTSAEWRRGNKLELIRRWFRQNEVQLYRSLPFAQLPSEAKRVLCARGYEKLLNRFSATSGPNCFAAAVGFPEQWLHQGPFLRQLKNHRKVRAPGPGDIITFRRGKTYVHAALALNAELYFEKPGQNFYEPYRVEYFRSARKEWPGTRVEIWRKP